MQIIFIKLNHQIYKLQCVIGDTLILQKELESKSFLKHDLMHYCVEKQAGLKYSFFGKLKNPKLYVEESEDNLEIYQTEIVVGILQSFYQLSSDDIKKCFNNIENAFLVRSEKMPRYINVDFIDKVCKRYEKLINQWHSLKTGVDSKLELGF